MTSTPPRLHRRLWTIAVHQRPAWLGVASVVLMVAAGIGLAGLGEAGVQRAVVSPYGSSLTVDGRGTFHAIGMGQWGALGYAVDKGWSSSRILDHYYGGTVASTVPDTTVTVLLSALNGAQTAVVHDQGGAVVQGAAGTGSYRSLVARETSASTYEVWGRTDASVCPSGSDPLRASDGWVKVASGLSPVVTFGTATNDPATNDLSRLLGVCDPGSSTVRYYRDRIRAVNTVDGGNRTVNVVGLDLMLRSVVAWEMSPSWADLGGGAGAQALQAQAVAARSYIMAYAWYPHARTCDNICVAYRGAAARSGGGSLVRYEDARATAAVQATAGLVRRRASGEIALTMYSASTGGWTAAGSGLASFPPVADAGDAYRAGQSGGNPWHSWTRTVSVSTVEGRWPSIGTLLRIDVVRNGLGDWGGRVQSVRLTGSAGSVDLQGDTFPRAVGLPSNWFNVRPPVSTTTTTTPPTTTPTTSTTVPTRDCGSRVAPAVTQVIGTSPASRLVAFTPRVVADTRATQRLAAGCTLRVDLGVRDGTTAVAVNVAAIAPSGAGAVTAYACGSAQPAAPTLVTAAGRPVTASGIVALGTASRLCVTSSVDTDIVVELYGRYTPTAVGRFTPVTPFRRFDSRRSTVDRVPAGREVRLRIAGRDGVPANATAVAATVHAMDASRTGAVSAYPCAAGPSGAAIVRLAGGTTVANGATLRLDRNGSVCVRSTTEAVLLLDVTGWYGRAGASSFRAVTPTATSLGGSFWPLENRSVTIAGRGPVPSSGVVAVAGALVVSGTTSESYVTVHACEATVPELSMVRSVPPAAGAISTAVVGLSPTGRWCIRPGAAMSVTVEVVGWFA